jgi:putative transposase
MAAAQTLAGDVGVQAACGALGLASASFYRWQRPCSEAPVRPRPPLALSAVEEQAVLDVLHSERFVDQAPAAAYATLLEEGTYHCSLRTMYRLLDRHGEIRERRNQLRHPVATRPELLATGPNQVWSWDITKLKGPAKWTYFYLYVLLDIFSRYVVGWLLADRESATLARRLIKESCEKEGIQEAGLTLHSDRGPAMTSKTVGQLLADLSITRSLTRPYTSNDNPFSESQFRTLKSRPEFPERFGSQQDTLGFLRRFFPWYNEEHRHSGIGFLTPASVHRGTALAVVARREETLAAAFAAHPERFKGKMPRVAQPPTEVWINPPAIDRKGEPSARSRRNVALRAPQTPAMESVQGPGTPRIVTIAAPNDLTLAALDVAAGQ